MSAGNGVDHAAIDSFVARTLTEISDQAFREAGTTPPKMEETAWTISTLTDESLERLVTFLTSLTTRRPLEGLAWLPHRSVLEALVSDIKRELIVRNQE